MTKNVIISVYDKTDLDIIAKFLIKKKFTIYSTGGTSDFLKKNNFPHIEISKYTKQKEIILNVELPSNQQLLGKNLNLI